MSIAKKFSARLDIFRELLSFFWKRKLWWLIPMIAILLLFALILVFAQSSALAPFIYTLF
ncbi:MAG: DUF5989 family protein [Candidatus Aminicenantales bacterium]